MTSSNKEPNKTAENETHAHKKSEQEHHESSPKKESHAHTKESHTKESPAHHNGHAKHSHKAPENFSDRFAAVKVEVRKKLKSFIHKLDKML